LTNILKITFITLCISVSLFSAPYWGKDFRLKQPDGSEVTVLVWGDEYFQHIESIDGRALVRNAQGWICYATMNPDSTEWVATNEKYTVLQEYNPAPNTAANPSTIQSKPVVRNRKQPMINKTARELKSAANKEKLGIQNLKWVGPGKKIKTKDSGNSELFQAAPNSSVGENPPISSSGYYQPAPPEPDSRLFRSGTIRALTILVDFEDEPATMPIAELDSLYNQIGYSKYGNNGSVRDYFNDVSLGKIDLVWDFVGYVRAPKPKSYYDNPHMTTPYEHTWEFINDVVRIADAQYDFSTLTQNPYNNNSVLSLTIMYAGNPSGGWTMGLWPHAGYLGITLDGQWIQGYSCVNIGDMSLEIGTIAHEAGHSIGNYADFYDMDGGGAGTGTYDLMGTGGGGNPPLLGPHNLIQSGWANVINVSYLDRDSVFELEANTNTVLQYDNPVNPENYYIEIRHNPPRPTPAEGIIIWHQDATFGVNNNREQMTPTEHYWMSVEQADNQFHLEKGINWGDPDDSFRAGHNAFFTNSSFPSSKWWDGSDSKLSITEISAVGPTMSLKIGARPGTYEVAQSNILVSAGLAYEAYEGVYETMPNFNAITSYKSGIAGFPDLAVANREDYFALDFTGYIHIPAQGYYSFYLKSDDGSRFWLNDRLLIDHDGLHDNFEEKNARVGLSAGLHSIRVEYFENAGGESLSLQWAGGRISKEEIPVTAYFHEDVNGTDIFVSSSLESSSSSSQSNSSNYWDFEGGQQGWTLTQGLTNSFHSSLLRLTVTEGDPQMHSPSSLNLYAGDYPFLQFGLRNRSSDTTAEFFWTRTTGPAFNANKWKSFTVVPNDNAQRTYVVDVGSHSAWIDTITQLRLDPVQNVSEGMVNLDFIKFSAAYPFANQAHAIPGILQVEDFNQGGQGNGYWDVSGENEGGAYRPDEGVDILSISGGGHAIGWVQSGEWLDYLMQADTDFYGDISIRAASVHQGDSIQLFLNGRALGEALVFSAGQGFDDYRDVGTTASIPAGLHVLRVQIVKANGGLNLDYIDFAPIENPVGGAITPNKAIELQGAKNAHGYDLQGRKIQGAPKGLWIDAHGKLRVSL
jgi:M6 family metalloprotease-like protein